MADRVRVAVFLHRGQDVRHWRARFAHGASLDRTPYGYDRAERWFDLTWAESPPDTRLGRALARWSMRLLGCDLPHAWHNRRLLRTADVVWTHTEREHLAVALLQWLRPGRRRVPVLAQSVWLWDRWASAGPLRRWLTAGLLRTHAVELVHSRLNLADSRAAVPGRRVELVPFGSAPAVLSAAAAARAAEPARPLVLSVGNDADRDWTLLASVASMIPGADFRVASRSRAAHAVAWPSNVTVRPAESTAELSELYTAAAAVAVPLRPNRHASGATVCIEGLAAGCRIVATRAGGIEDYLGPQGRTAEPGDVAGFASALEAALHHDFPAPGPQAYLDRGLTQADYVGRYVLVTRAVLGAAPWDPRISEFAPVGVLDEPH